MVDFTLNSAFSFETLAPSLLTAKIKNATLTAIMNYQKATQHFNPNAVHANVYPNLPAGVSRDLTKYTYFEFETENGERLYLAKEWINMNTVVLVTGTTTRITIYNTNINDTQKLQNYLKAAGYDSFSVETL